MEENKQNVIVTNIHMPFSSMVTFMVKWALASIPAMIILLILWTLFLSGFFAKFIISN